MLLLFLIALHIVLSTGSPPATLDGLWTTIPSSDPPLHDALRITSTQVRCQHGGYLNLTSLPCTFAQASITLDQDQTVTLNNNTRGTFTAHSNNCSWTSAAPGNYWTGASAFPPPFTPACSVIQFENDGPRWIRLREINKVHVVSMSHLDVGYTGSIAFTLNSYFANFFPTAIRVQEELDQMVESHDFHYVTHPWLVYLYLHCDELTEMAPDLDVPIQCPNATSLVSFTKAVARGTITWHAGPMNMQVEWMTKEMLEFGVTLSHVLDDVFHLPHKTVLSQRDVPGMTRSVVPILTQHNITGITVGVNGGVCPAQVPMLFRWRAPGGEEVVASWHPGGYPDEYSCGPKGMKHCNERLAGPLARRQCMMAGDEAFCFAFRTDNTGPPVDAEEVLAGFHVAQTQFPTSTIIAGSLDDFYATASKDTSLPVVTKEIGDVWIPGVSSDPWKASTTRRMQKAWSEYHHQLTTDKVVSSSSSSSSMSTTDTSSMLKAGVYLLKLTEHTWGLSDLYNKSQNWTNAILEEQMERGDFDVNIADWDLQRDFTSFAKNALPVGHPLKKKWSNILNRPTPFAPNISSYVVLPSSRAASSTTTSPLVVCPKSSLGAFTLHYETGSMSSSDGMELGRFHYENLNENVYNVSSFACDAVFGGKHGSSNYTGGKKSKSAAATINTVYYAPSSSSSLLSSSSSSSSSLSTCDVWLELDIIGDGEGLPKSAWIRYVIHEKSVDITFVALEKQRTRFNEAGWLSFDRHPPPTSLPTSLAATGSMWGMTKLGSDVAFDEVVLGGSSGVHAADSVWWRSNGSSLVIESLDAPVLAPTNIHRPPTVLLNEQEKLELGEDIHGVGFNLWNNVWSTNYLFFYPWHEKDSNISYSFHVNWS